MKLRNYIEEVEPISDRLLRLEAGKLCDTYVLMMLTYPVIFSTPRDTTLAFSTTKPIAFQKHLASSAHDTHTVETFRTSKRPISSLYIHLFVLPDQQVETRRIASEQQRVMQPASS